MCLTNWPDSGCNTNLHTSMLVNELDLSTNSNSLEMIFVILMLRTHIVLLSSFVTYFFLYMLFGKFSYCIYFKYITFY